MRRRLILSFALAIGLALPVQAGGLFKKSPKPDGATYVPQLLETIKTSKEEKVRLEAIAELREFDAKVYPDIHPVLIELLTNDPSASIRDEAAATIGKVRPISHRAGYALEQARSNDKSFAVRFTAQSSLLQYRLLGYFGGGKQDVTVVQTKEPPLAIVKAPVSPSTTTPAAAVTMPDTRSTSAKPSLLPTVISGRIQTAEPPKAVDPTKIPTIVPPPPATPRTFVPPPSDEPKPSDKVVSNPSPTIVIPIPGDKGTPSVSVSNTKPTPPPAEGPTLGPPPPN